MDGGVEWEGGTRSRGGGEETAVEMQKQTKINAKNCFYVMHF